MANTLCLTLQLYIDRVMHGGGSSSSREPKCQIVAPILPAKPTRLVRPSTHSLSAQREGSYAPPPPSRPGCQHSRRPLLFLLPTTTTSTTNFFYPGNANEIAYFLPPPLFVFRQLLATQVLLTLWEVVATQTPML